MTGNKMISRRRIIRGQQECGQQLGEQGSSSSSVQQASSASSSNKSAASSKSSGRQQQVQQAQMQQAAHPRGQQQQQQQQQQQAVSRGRQRLGPQGRGSGPKQAGERDRDREREERQPQQQDNSDGYTVNPYEDYADERQQAKDYWRQQDNMSGRPETRAGQGADYRNFDPYSIYSEEDDVWYSEERLFEDHLEEIFNKWRLLDDDIWCKLIIMERNRRIGKAYARVPIVTIDGSHELSYDGYKLALNGFDNPDRDAKTEECRKRIGKGIRIKMDNYGNILIKRLSKSGVYIKEWLQGSANLAGGRAMPSRQQLIRNQNAAMAAMSNGADRALGSQISSLATSATPSSSSAGSSMDPPNDSAICDEVISVGGRLDQDKIYVMFDMKKFQANITQELCRPYPDKRKLEQQCFSIIGLARDADEVLDLPCWVMVINIVAIEMLNERFPLMSYQSSNFPDSMLMDTSQRRPGQPPNFVSIFEQNNTNSNPDRSKEDSNKEEDPYSLPANASTSDVKSSMNDYGTTSTKNVSSMLDSSGHQQAMPARYFGASKRADLYNHKKDLATRGHDASVGGENIRHRSRSNCNIYGPPSTRLNQRDRYNNSSSIYSPGHMLVPPSGDPIPPKLPPRDFGKQAKSKSSSNVNQDGLSKMQPNNESIYSIGLKADAADASADLEKARKTKKNRFLESLKAPLELAKSNRSASVMGAPVQTSEMLDPKGAAKGRGFTKSGAKNLKSLLGVKGSKAKETISDDSSYMQANGGNKTKRSTRALKESVEVDSVVDSNEEVEDGNQGGVNSPSSASYNDLDIPTPDYETDENIYALEDRNYENGLALPGEGDKRRSAVGAKSLKGSRSHNKEDLYYSGYRAHVPQNIGANGALTRPSQGGKPILEDKISCLGSRENSRFMVHNGKQLVSSKSSGREMIYGSTTGLPMNVGARYRSASMQRYYPQAQPSRSQNEIYDLETENPYATSAAPDAQGHYGVTGHRKRPGNKMSASHYGGALHRVGSSMASSNYDIGRSSSGIYGNNSSSSSSDYTDWHPQMRKVNSSGYLNSIFKTHAPAPVDPFNGNPLTGNTGSSQMAAHSYNNKQQQSRNFVSRTLKSNRPASVLSKQQLQHRHLHQQAQIHHPVASSIVNGPTYRSYDSSNDSEPSYTNSSDGLDIYDHIETHSRLNHHQFLDIPPAHAIPSDVHVGEWENMYDR